MAAQQTTVSSRMAFALAGQLADSNRKNNCDAKTSAEASAEIPFGVAVVRHSSDEDNLVVKPHTSAAAAAPLFAGIVVHNHAYVRTIELGDTGLKPKVTMDVLQNGRIYVFPEDAVDPGDSVKFRVVVAGSEVAGAFRAAADSTDCVDISKFARWITSGSSTVPAILEIDMAGASMAVADT